MDRSALRQIVAKAPLPNTVMNRIDLVRFADANHILGQMASLVTDDITDRLHDIFRNALLRAEHDHTMLKFEMNRLEHALKDTGIEPIVLKGGAYVARGKQAAGGRRVSDLDILVAVDELEEVEARLKQAGWAPDDTTDNEYDQAYYRTHMHELPPLRHEKRGTIIDVHHRLLPKTARLKIDVDAMRQATKNLNGQALKTFDDVNMFIHSAVHAFADGAVDTPARSLVELFLLYSELSDDDASRLLARALDVGATKPVSVALWTIAAFFETSNAAAPTSQYSVRKPNVILRWAIAAKTFESPLAPLAKGFLYIRSHYLRMPLYLLVPHLMRKAIAWRPRSQQPVELPFP